MKQIIVDNISTTYYITEDGKCYNSITGKFLKGQVNCRHGYHSYNLTLPDGSEKRISTHRLVALHYLPRSLDKNKTHINHIDGNKLNNCVDNLEWCTPSENLQHSFNIGLREGTHVYCFNKEKILVAEYKTIKEAAESTKLNYNSIGQELNKDIKQLYGGFYWSKENTSFPTIMYKNTGKAKQVNQYTKDGKFINSYSSCGEAARSLGLRTSSHIGECCRGKIKSCAGFVWRYSEDIVSPSDES